MRPSRRSDADVGGTASEAALEVLAANGSVLRAGKITGNTATSVDVTWDGAGTFSVGVTAGGRPGTVPVVPVAVRPATAVVPRPSFVA